MTEKEMLDLPTGVVSFYMDTVDPRTPGITGHFLTYVKITFVFLKVFLQHFDDVGCMTRMTSSS